MKRLLAFFLLLLSMAVAMAQDTAQNAAVPERSFDQEAMQRYRQSDTYIYDRTPPVNNDLIAIIKRMFERLLKSVFSDEQAASAWKVAFYVIMIGALVAIVFNLFGMDIRFLFKPSEKKITEYTVQEENIREMDIDTLIANAAAGKQWKLGQRYLYIKALRMMADGELIKWKPGKTNMEYYYELKQLPVRMLFAELTTLFEAAWYGEKAIEEDEYRSQQQRFEQFYTLIKQQA